MTALGSFLLVRMGSHRVENIVLLSVCMKVASTLRFQEKVPGVSNTRLHCIRVDGQIDGD